MAGPARRRWDLSLCPAGGPEAHEGAWKQRGAWGRGHPEGR